MSDKEKAEETLRLAAERYRRLTEHARDLIFRRRLAPDEAWEYVSPAIVAMTGYTAEEFRSNKNFVLDRLTHPEDRPLWLAMRESPDAFNKPIVLRWTRKDGATIWVEINMWAIQGKDGVTEAIEGIARDITDRKRSEEEAEQLRSDLQAEISNELKTPLTTIKGAAATALSSDRPLDDLEARELFQIIDQQANRLRGMVGELLNSMRARASRLTMTPGPVDLHPLLEEARARFARAGGRQHVTIDTPADLPIVAADRMRISQVLDNLLSNAGRFSPPASTIEVDVEYNGVDVTFHVRDQGKGIPKENLPALFQKPAMLEQNNPGGMGLVIAREIVEAHGGRIWVESPGQGLGATFSFTLPAMPSTPAVQSVGLSSPPVVAEPSPKLLPAPTRKTEHLGKVSRAKERTRVLVVDDEAQIVTYIQRALDTAGYQPLTTTEPSEALQIIDSESPDLVLLDLKMGTANGLDILQEIRKTSGVPVIIVTGSEASEGAARALGMGADDYVTKPFSMPELLARVEAVLRRRAFPDIMEVREPFVLAGLVIDFSARRVTVDGKEVALSATEYKILYELVEHAGRTMTFDQILQRVWGPEYSGETALVRSFIRNLRKKLGDDANNPRFILTERQVGYRMPKP